MSSLGFGPEADSSTTPVHRSGDFEFHRELGRGGMGVVYEAHQISLNRRVAVKMLPSRSWLHPVRLPRFHAEAEAVARLRHPGIVTIHEVGELDGQPFFSMELVEGPSLETLVRHQSLAPMRAAELVRQVAEAIEHAHQNRILHRDLKPSNVLLDLSGRPKVTDFGLAKQFDAATGLTQSGELLGSPSYLPPEALSGEAASPAGDIYALGGILYHLLTARPAFVGPTAAATLEQIRTSPPVSPRVLNPEIPRDLETICLKCLSKEPHRRYPSAAALAQDLQRFEGGEPILARRVTPTERLKLWCRRKPALAAALTVAALAMVLGLWGVLWQWRIAEVRREEMRVNLYAADVSAASFALRDGNFGRARQLLELHRPKSPPQPDAHVKTGPTGDRDQDLDLRDFAWRLLWNRCQSSELLTLGTHPWIVTCLAVSPDGRWVASGSQDQPGDGSQSLKVWDLSLGREAGAAGRTFGASNTLWSLAFSTDSRTLISAGERGVRFWNVATGAEQPAPPLPLAREIALAGQTLVLSPNHPFVSNEPLSPLWLYDLQSGQGRELGVSGRHPALSPDGRQLAFLTAAMEIQVMDLSTPGRVRTVATQRPAFRLRFSPDGQRLAAAGHSAEARIWDLTPWEKNPDASLSAPLSFSHEHNVWDVCFSPDGNRLITATSNQRLEAWESRTARSLGRWTGHAGEVWTVLMTPDGQHLVSGGKDQTVRLWSSTPPTLATSAPHWRYARPAFAPNGQLLYTYVQASGGGGSTEIWNLNGDGAIGTKVFSTRGFARGFAPDGRHLLFLSEEPPTLEWKPLDAHAPTRRVQLRDVAHPMIRGEFLLAGDNRSFVCPDIGGGLSRWSTEDGSRTASMTNALLARQIERLTRGGSIPDRLVRSAAISRRGRWVAFGCFDTGGTLLLDLEHPQSGGQLLAGHRDDVSALAFSEDESTLASGSVDGTIRLWSTTDGTLKANLPGHLESVEAVAFSPDGRTLVSVNPGIELKLWHLPTLREIACIPAPEAGLHLAFSPSGESLAVGLTPGRREGGSDRVELWRAPRPNGL